MTHLLAIAAGGALGSILRYLMSTGIYRLLGQGFPWGTLAVNLVGSLLAGALYVLLLERMHATPELRGFLLAGLLGGFTTFSTFSLETLVLLEQGEPGRALINVVLSVVLCIGGAWLGLLAARQI